LQRAREQTRKRTKRNRIGAGDQTDRKSVA
jgi:hypothetical protein